MESSSKFKVQPGKIVTRIEEIDTTIEVRFSKPVDEQMLSLFETIQDSHSSQANSRDESLNHVSQTIYRAQRSISSSDKTLLDELAQDLSHSALKIGASKLLSSAIEVQGMARIGDFKGASDLLGRMEAELVEVRAHYQ